MVGRPSDPPTRPPTGLSTPAHILARFGEGLALHQQGRVTEAGRIYHEVLARQPDHFDALHLLGLVAAQTGQPQRAIELIGRAIALNPNVPALYSNLAKALGDLGRYEEAVESCDAAIRLAPDLAGAYVNRGDALAGLKRHAAALASYDKAIALDPAVPAAHNDRANSLQALNRSEDAVAGYDAAIALSPDYAEAFSGRGAALQKLRRPAEALASYNRAIALNPRHAETYNNLGNLFVDLKRYHEAIGAYATAMAVRADYPFLFGTWLHTRMKVCDWFDFDASLAEFTRKLDAGEQVSPPFPLLSLPTTLQQQRKGAGMWSATMFPPDASLPPIARPTRPGPLRVGYFSADFYNHATAWLIAGLFEQHDRAKVEPIAFSFDLARDDEMAQRLSAGVDRFIDVSRMLRSGGRLPRPQPRDRHRGRPEGLHHRQPDGDLRRAGRSDPGQLPRLSGHDGGGLHRLPDRRPDRRADGRPGRLLGEDRPPAGQLSGQRLTRGTYPTGASIGPNAACRPTASSSAASTTTTRSRPRRSGRG